MINTRHISLYVQDYKACRGSKTSCTFIDAKNDSLEVNSETLYMMFRFMMKELKRNGEWDALEESVLSHYPDMPKVIYED